MMRSTPVAMAQKPMYRMRTVAVTSGAWNVITPKAIPSSPSSNITHQRSSSLRTPIAWNTLKHPSTNANAPKKITSVTRVMPGHE